jgi:hypothetical protein
MHTNNPRRNVLLGILTLMLLALPSTAFADSPAPPRDYSVVTESGEFVFVMLAREELSAYNQVGFIRRDEELRQKYSQSGLYRNDGSSTPLWTVDWYSFSVEISSDGRHLAKFGPWAGSGDYGELAIAFNEDAKEIASYRVDQLVTIPFYPFLPHSKSHYEWLKTSEFDDKQGTLDIETMSGERYTFNIATGMPSNNLILPWPKCLNFLALISLIWLGFRAIRRHRARSMGGTTQSDLKVTGESIS